MHRNAVSDLLEVLRNFPDGAIERDDDEDVDPLSRLNIRQSLNRFRESTRSRIGRVFRGEMDYRDSVA